MPDEYSKYCFSEVTPNVSGVTTIAHISDLHFSPDTSENDPLLEAARQSLMEQKVDVVVCTGDIIDQPLLGDHSPEAHRQAAATAKTWLEALCGGKERAAKSLVVVPGNHDYKISGIKLRLPKWELFKVAVWDVLRLATSDVVKWNQERKPLALGIDKELFRSEFGEYFRPLFLPGLQVCVFDVNSNLGVSAMDFAQGEITQEEILRFVGEIKAFKNHDEAHFNLARKIVAVHHHPMPIPESETWQSSQNEPLMVLKNAGSFLREMIKADIDIVLHGHKHHPGFSRAAFEYQNKVSKPIGVLAAGSIARTDEKGGYSYNLIRIHHDGPADSVRMVCRPGATYDKESPEPMLIHGADDRRREKFDQGVKKFKSLAICDEVFFFHSFDSYGDCEEVTEYKWLRPLRESPVSEIPQSVENSWSVIEPIRFLCLNTGTQITFKQESQDENGVAGKLVFAKTLKASEPLFIEARGKTSFAYATTEELCKLKNGGSDSEGFGFGARTIVSNRMVMSIRFPRGLRPANLHLSVKDENGNDDPKEKQELEDRLFTFVSPAYPEQLVARLYIDYPVPGYEYKFVWNPPAERTIIGDGNAVIAEALVQALLDAGKRNRLREVLKGFVERLKSGFGMNQEDIRNSEIGLMAHDGKALRYVAGIEPDEHEIYGKLMMSLDGKVEGIEGFTYLSGRAYSCLRDTMVWKKFYKTPAWKPNHKLMVCVPLRYPAGESGRIVYLLRFATSSVRPSLLEKGPAGKGLSEGFLDPEYWADFHRQVVTALGISLPKAP